MDMLIAMLSIGVGVTEFPCRPCAVFVLDVLFTCFTQNWPQEKIPAIYRFRFRKLYLAVNPHRMHWFEYK